MVKFRASYSVAFLKCYGPVPTADVTYGRRTVSFRRDLAGHLRQYPTEFDEAERFLKAGAAVLLKER